MFPGRGERAAAGARALAASTAGEAGQGAPSARRLEFRRHIGRPPLRRPVE